MCTPLRSLAPPPPNSPLQECWRYPHGRLHPRRKLRRSASRGLDGLKGLTHPRLDWPFSLFLPPPPL